MLDRKARHDHLDSGAALFFPFAVTVTDDRRSETGGSRFWVTCYTDASFAPGAAGWAVWLKSARGRIVRHGACPAYVSSANEAEMAAIFAGIYLSRRAWGAAVRGIVVYTDSRAAIDLLSAEALRPRVQRNASGIVRLRGRIRALAANHGIELDLRWVKGHQTTNTARAFLNAACDQLARAARVAAKRDGEKLSSTAERRNGPDPCTGAPAEPVVEGPQKRSKKQKARERRQRAREKRRAKRAAGPRKAATGRAVT